jgi:preprotein translocase subunit SecA
VAYKNEAFELFRDLMNTIWSDFARMIFHVEVEVEGANGNGAGQYDPANSTGGARQITYSGGAGATQPSALAAAAAGAGVGYAETGYDEEAVTMPVVEQRRVDESEQIGRNDPCWCGSGKKFKKCHGA